MAELTSGQVSTSAARVYEDLYVPALFQEWPSRLLDRAVVNPGDRVLDVATGTGIVAREAARRTEPSRVTGIDINPDMLAVAREIAPAIDWREANATTLPFDDEAFDIVTCEFALMFFDDRVAALREMWRVLARQGRLVVATWASLDESPGYREWVALVEEELGADAATGLRSPFVLGDTEELQALFQDAGIDGVRIETVDGWGSFGSIDDWVEVDIRGWVLSDAVDDALLERLKAKARTRLAEFVDDRGRSAFRAPAHIMLATKA